MGNSFKDAIPEIEDYVKVVEKGRMTAEINNQPLKIEKIYYASTSFFHIFSYPLIGGDKDAALKVLNGNKDFKGNIGTVSAQILFNL